MLPSLVTTPLACPFRLAALAILLGGAAALCGCSATGDSMPEMRGSKVGVRILDAQRVESRGRESSWDEFLEQVAQAVAAAKEDVDALPWIVIQADRSTAPGLVDELLEALHEIGVRSISLGT
jgi:biopolymer transport protein ExbD